MRDDADFFITQKIGRRIFVNHERRSPAPTVQSDYFRVVGFPENHNPITLPVMLADDILNLAHVRTGAVDYFQSLAFCLLIDVFSNAVRADHHCAAGDFFDIVHRLDAGLFQAFDHGFIMYDLAQKVDVFPLQRHRPLDRIRHPETKSAFTAQFDFHSAPSCSRKALSADFAARSSFRAVLRPVSDSLLPSVSFRNIR